MKKYNYTYATAVLLVLFILSTVACSKSTTPAPPSVVDSTGGSQPDTSAGAATDSSKPEIPVIHNRNVPVSAFPILNATAAGGLFLGGIVKSEDLAGLDQPVITVVDNTYRNPLTIYTNAPIDSSALQDLYPSRGNDQKLLNNILGAGLSQYVSSTSGTPEAFNHRYNSLRDFFGADRDVNKLLDLGFPDTTALDTTKGRVVMAAELVTASLLLQLPVAQPYLKLKPADENWKALFGAGDPKIISEIDYGMKVLMVFESPAGSAKLTLALNKYLSHSLEEILGGQALSVLSGEDQAILKGAVAYGYMLGKEGAMPHSCTDALTAYATELSRIGQDHYIGKPIDFKLNDLQDWSLYASGMTIGDYDQKTLK